MTEPTQPELTVNTEPIGSPSVGNFALDEDTRTLRGILLPFGERSKRSTTGHEVEFSADAITLPRDPSVVTLNRRHSQHDPVGRATFLEKRDVGVYAEFRIADTDEGDQYLAEQRGTFRKLSAEVADLITEGVHALKSRLTGAALVPEGAFASAALFELADEENERLATPEERAVLDTSAWDDYKPNGPTDTQAPTPVTTDETTPSVTDEKENNMADAVVPDGVQVVTPEAEKLDKNGLFEAIAYAKQSGDYQSLEQIKREGTAQFALSDVKISGASTLGLNTVQPAWLGQLWQGNDAVRNVIPELKHAELTALEVKGFRFTTPPTVAAWTGNKTDIPSGATAVQVITGNLQRFAAGYDIAREFYDIPAGRPVIESFVQTLVNSYATVTDTYVMGQLIAAAGTGTVAETYPTGISAPIGRVMQGALKVIDNGGTPTFAFLSPDQFKLLAYTPRDQVTEFLSGSLSLTGGQYAGITIKPHASLTAGQVLVGDGRSATVFELPGAPIRVNALDIAKGGVDEAVFGYVGFVVERPETLQLIKTA